jgi:hypothetical protein
MPSWTHRSLLTQPPRPGRGSRNNPSRLVRFRNPLSPLPTTGYPGFGTDLSTTSDTYHRFLGEGPPIPERRYPASPSPVDYRPHSPADLTPRAGWSRRFRRVCTGVCTPCALAASVAHLTHGAKRVTG